MSDGHMDLQARIGETLRWTVPLFDDAAEKTPSDLTGKTVEAVLEPYDLGEDEPITLTAEEGVTIDAPESGVVDLEVTIDPERFDVGIGHWLLKVTDSDGAVSYPQMGALTIGKP